MANGSINGSRERARRALDQAARADFNRSTRSRHHVAIPEVFQEVPRVHATRLHDRVHDFLEYFVALGALWRARCFLAEVAEFFPRGRVEAFDAVLTAHRLKECFVVEETKISFLNQTWQRLSECFALSLADRWKLDHFIEFATKCGIPEMRPRRIHGRHNLVFR